jgi:hypothetical protein
MAGQWSPLHVQIGRCDADILENSGITPSRRTREILADRKDETTLLSCAYALLEVAE